MENYKSLVLKITSERIHPLLIGIYQTIFSTEQGRTHIFDIVSEHISDDSPIILECGANTGTSTEKFLNRFENPNIHTFEPVPKHIDVLNKKFSDNDDITIHEMAVGPSEGTIRIGVARKSNASSVLEIDTLQKYQSQNDFANSESYEIKDKIEVKQSRIDNIVNNCDIIKLDIEGYELEALRGASELLDDTKCIIAEVAFLPLHSGQPLFSDVDLFLRNNGFQLYDFDSLRRGPDGQLMATHAIWFSSDFYSETDGLIYPVSR